MSDNDYTLLDGLLSLGGRLVKSDDFSAWVNHADNASHNADNAEVAERGSPVGRARRSAVAEDASSEGDTLSMAHISPFIEWCKGASLLRASKGGECEQVGGGKRKAITGFSAASRRRLMQTIATVERDAVLPNFVTLTYPAEYPNPKQSKRHLDTFFKRFTRAFSEHGSIWKLEPQQRGAPHYHLLTWGCDLSSLAEFVPGAWYDIAGGGDPNHLKWHLGLLGRGNRHCVQEVRSFRGVWSYASKYLGKTFEVSGWSDKWTGRYWGVVNRQNIPFGEAVTLPVDYRDAVQVMRYQRRFSGLRSRSSRSLTVYCDADQWIQKLQIGGDVLTDKR